MLSVLFVCLEDSIDHMVRPWAVGLDPPHKKAEIITHYLGGGSLFAKFVEVSSFRSFFCFHDVTIPQIEMIASFILFFFSLYYRELVECIKPEVDAEGRRLGQVAPVFDLVKQ